MNVNCKAEAHAAIEVIDIIRTNLCEIGKSRTDNKGTDAKRIREIKMMMLKLKAISRLVFGDIQNSMDYVEKEMVKADNVLVDVHRLDSEISSLKRTVATYTSFSTPRFDSVNLPKQESKKSEDGKQISLFENRCEALRVELNERKRLKEQLDEEDKIKKQCMMTTVQLKHHVQNIVSKQMESAEDAIMKASESCMQIVDKEEEESEKESIRSEVEVIEPLESTPMEEENEG